jgi:hypothetical protein
MALAVASDAYVLGKKAVAGDVLVLALEDNARRLQSRLKKLVGPFVEFPKRLTLATEWPRANEGGVEKIEAWIKSVPNPRLIVVDVLQKFRALQGSSQNAYAVDYEAVSGLQKLASEHHVAIVICHHLRKMASDSDAFDKISGTMGLSGAADAALVLDRDGSGEFTLQGRGRDIEEIDLAVRFDKGTCKWQVLGEASDVRRSDERKEILAALREAGRPMKRTEIAAAVEKAQNATDQLLWKMVRNCEVTKSDRGLYTLIGDKNDKIVRTSQPIISPPPY